MDNNGMKKGRNKKNKYNKCNDEENEIKNDTSNETEGETVEDKTEEETLENFDLDKLRIQLQNINIIRQELVKLDLNLSQKVYYETEIIPLLTTLEFLAFSSESLASGVDSLFNTNISKNSKLKNTVDLIYDINDSCEDVYRALRSKLKVLINIGKI